MNVRLNQNRTGRNATSRSSAGAGAGNAQNSSVSTSNAVSGSDNDSQRDGNSNDDARHTDQMGGVPSFTQADFRPEFRISVRPPPGGTSTPVPALMNDWRDAALDAAGKERGMMEIEPQLQKARDDATQQAGRKLEKWEVRQVELPLIKQLLPPVRAKHYKAIMTDSSSQQGALDDALSRHGARLQKARDPFMPLALGDPQARSKDRVLWENPSFMVVVDSFSPGAKALVIPKTPAMFPGDLAAGAMDEISKIAAKVSDAFGVVSGSAPADIWVNPPQRLTIKQLHAHVLPTLPNWENPGPGEPGGRDRRSPTPAPVVAEMDRFFTALEAELSRVL